MTTDELEAELRELSGKVTALEFAVKMLTVTHPDRQRFARVWHRFLPEQIDAFMQNPIFDNTTTRDAITRNLADLLVFAEMKLPD